MFLVCGKMTCGKIQFWEAQNGNFLCSHSLWQQECGHPVWRPWLTIDCFLETVADHRDLMTSAESIYYTLVDIWEVFRISPLISPWNSEICTEATNWHLDILIIWSRVKSGFLWYRTLKSLLTVFSLYHAGVICSFWHIQNSSHVCKQCIWSLVDLTILYCLNISKHVIFFAINMSKQCNSIAFQG